MRFGFFCLLGASLLLSACDQGRGSYTGYVEGDYARPAPIASGRLVELAVARGDEVKAGALLFTLDDQRERAARDQAAATLAEAKARLANLLVGKRPVEIDEVRASKKQADARLRLAEISLARQTELMKIGASSRQQFDDAESEARTARALVKQMTASIAVAELPGRDQEILAAQSDVDVNEAVLRQATWDLDQRRVTAARAARVEDSFFRVGEFIPAATPVLSLLPVGNVYIKFYVPQADLPHFAQGREVEFRCDGCAQPIKAKVRFVASAAEYTPPVIYSENSRDKLVFRIEATPDRLEGLHPGLPVDVILPAGKS
ncbi:HlyD family secretion protein [Govanella unica]|uniref:HlyD family efflux transporter periplasmic adaptor subunit n=1 Tax=Govanella unica TaxID=2975056 RepID=A0A9X3TZW1_9PROT|nr:HlyD family efflux transporter periplasmic adaptor subunit [Govania unica]MDA5194849.1 HlyD family efflux transporter periplasmic adaptor subunit [Govania unica]